VTAGNQSLTATDTQSGSITGSQSGIAVTAAAADHFLVVPSVTTTVLGIPFDVTVTALDPYGNIDSNYQGIITLATSDPDPGILLPGDYTLTIDDSGVHTFAAGVSLVTPGDQTLIVTDTNGFKGSATITVIAPQAPPGGGRARSDDF